MRTRSAWARIPTEGEARDRFLADLEDSAVLSESLQGRLEVLRSSRGETDQPTDEEIAILFALRMPESAKQARRALHAHGVSVTSECSKRLATLWGSVSREGLLKVDAEVGRSNLRNDLPLATQRREAMVFLMKFRLEAMDSFEALGPSRIVRESIEAAEQAKLLAAASSLATEHVGESKRGRAAARRAAAEALRQDRAQRVGLLLRRLRLVEVDEVSSSFLAEAIRAVEERARRQGLPEALQ